MIFSVRKTSGVFADLKKTKHREDEDDKMEHRENPCDLNEKPNKFARFIF